MEASVILGSVLGLILGALIGVLIRHYFVVLKAKEIKAQADSIIDKAKKDADDMFEWAVERSEYFYCIVVL